MNCPRCKLVNPPTAKRCDCGYDFETRTVERSYVQRPSPSDTLRVCPECKTRVLPTVNNECPACRRHTFDPERADPLPGEASHESAASATGGSVQETTSRPGLFRRALSFKGRLNRWDFMRVVLFLQLANLALYLSGLLGSQASKAMDDTAADPVAGLLLASLLLLWSVFSVALTLSSVVQRCHDIHRSGMWAWLLLVPLLNIVLLVVLLVRPSVPFKTEAWG